MAGFRELFQWERFITPSIIKLFYGLAIVLTVLVAAWSAIGGVMLMPINPLAGLVTIVASLVGALAAIVFIRIAAEFVLVTFRINEHLSALRERVDG